MSSQFALIGFVGVGGGLAFFAKPILRIWSGSVEVASAAAPILFWYGLAYALVGVLSLPFMLQFARGEAQASCTRQHLSPVYACSGTGVGGAVLRSDGCRTGFLPGKSAYVRVLGAAGPQSVSSGADLAQVAFRYCTDRRSDGRLSGHLLLVVAGSVANRGHLGLDRGRRHRCGVCWSRLWCAFP